MEQEMPERFEQWAIIELFGHNVIAGFVSEQTIGGAALVRVDVPQVDDNHPAFTKFFGGGAIYAMTPTSEQHARQAAAQIRVRPVALYVLPEPKRQLEVRAASGEPDGYPDGRYDDDDNDDNPF